MKKQNHEYEFVLSLENGFDDYDRLEGALFKAGCDDATLSLRYGRLFLAFAREATSYEEAVVSAIADVAKAGTRVHQVDGTDLVTQAEIARRVGRSRRLISQYVAGKRGPGGFPPPDCTIAEGTPVWKWCAVSHCLHQNAMINEATAREAQVAWTVNLVLKQSQRSRTSPATLPEFEAGLAQRVMKVLER